MTDDSSPKTDILETTREMLHRAEQEIIAGESMLDQINRELYKKNVELKKANDELKQLDAMKDQLIAVASHELRTPASEVKNYLWMVLNKDAAKEGIGDLEKGHLQKAFQANERLIKLVNNILDVSRIQGGKVQADLKAVDLLKAAKQVVEETAPLWQQRDLKVEVMESATPLPPVLADQEKVLEVFTNLISNAIKFSEKQGVVISFEDLGEEVVTHIEDHGQGIEEEEIPHLFQRFYRADHSLSSSNEQTGGTGLGLYISKSYVELMGGRVWVTSKRSKGSIFSFSLPVLEKA